MSSERPKVHIPVTKDMNGWYMFAGRGYRVQLSGDSRKGGFWLEQFANRLGKENFMRDFTEILQAIEAENSEIKKRNNGEYPIGIFNLYLPLPNNEHRH